MGKLELTSKQKKVLALIQGQFRATSSPPTHRELARALGVDVRAAYQHVVALERKNVVLREGKPSRISLNPEYRPQRGLPVLGRVPAGAAADSELEVDRYLDLDELLTGDDLFMLAVHGDSMVDRGIMNGDLVVVRSQAPVSDGNVVVASIDNEQTIKTLRTRSGQRYLCPENAKSDYPTVLLDREGARLLGRVVWVVRDLR